MSGCLPLLIQLPILMSLYWVVRKPIIYTMDFGGDEVWRIVSAIEEWGFSNPDALKNFLGQLRFLDHGYVWWLVLEVVFAVVASIALNRVIDRTYPHLKTNLLMGRDRSILYNGTGDGNSLLFTAA